MIVKTKKPTFKNSNNKQLNSINKQLTKIDHYLKRQKFDDALFILERIYPKIRFDLHMNLLIGEVHLKIGQYREAKKYFKRVLELEPDNFQALHGIGNASYLKGETHDAIRYLERASYFELYRADVYNDIGTIYEEIKDLEKAKSFYTKSINQDINLVLPVINLSSLLTRQGIHEEALDYIREFLKENDPDENLSINQGIILESLNRYEEAVESFSYVITKNIKKVDAYYNRAFCYLKLTRIEDARRDLKEYLKVKPDDERIRGLLALTYTLEGKFVDSMDTWKEFLPLYRDLQVKISRTFISGKINPIQILENIEINGKNNSQKPPKLSIVIPVLDEEGSIIILYEKLKSVLKQLKQTYEIIFIDDGSKDRSLDILTDITNKDAMVSVIKFRRNYGQTAAFAAGFKYASGDVVITMDADLQNDPEDIPRLLEKMSEGYDLVSGWRKDRKDKTITRKMPSFIANRLINKLIAGSGIHIHDFGCSLKAYKKGIIKNIKLYGEMHRFIPAYAAWLGIKVAEIPVKHHSRKYGYSKYGLERVGRVVLDLITLRFFTGYKSRPLQFFGKISLFVMVIGIVFSLCLLILGSLTEWGIDFQSFILMTLFSVLGGSQFIMVGLLSEIIMRGFLEAQDRDEYVVESILQSPSIMMN